MSSAFFAENRILLALMLSAEPLPLITAAHLAAQTLFHRRSGTLPGN